MAVHVLHCSYHRHIIANIESGENTDDSLLICFALHDGNAAWELV